MSIEQVTKKWYVYLLCDPDTEQPFYVGKGTGNRMGIHERELQTMVDGNPAKKRIIKQILASGKEVLKKKVAEFQNETDAYIYEWAMINLYGERLVNIRDNGKARRVDPPAKPSQPRMKFYNVKDLQEVLGLSERTIFRFIENDELRGVKIGREWRFTQADIDAFIDLQRKKTEAKKRGGESRQGDVPEAA